MYELPNESIRVFNGPLLPKGIWMSKVNSRVQSSCNDLMCGELNSVVRGDCPDWQVYTFKHSHDSMRQQLGLLSRVKLSHEHI